MPRQYAKQSVPESQWAYTPMYLYATAGMRLLPIDTQNQILDSCRSTMKSYPFLFRSKVYHSIRCD